MSPAPDGSVAVVGATTELDRAVNERLLDQDLRYTRGRRAIVDGLRAAGGPVTLPQLLELAPGLPQSSAYRNLALLEEAGVVRRLVHGAEHARYELAEVLTEHHHHLVCESCGLVLDVVFDDGVESTLDTAIARIAHNAGFVTRDHAIDVFGSCADCAA